MPVILAAASLIVSAVGVGLAYTSSQAAAKQQQSAAMANYNAQTIAARQAGEAQSMQARISAQIASNEKATMDRNAITLEQQASVNTQVGNENARRTREDFARMVAAQRAAIGKSGVVDTSGSPMQLLAASAEGEQIAVSDARFQTEGQRRGLFREADNQRAQGVAAEMNVFDAQARGGAAKLSAQNQLGQAQLDLYSSTAAAKGMARQGFANAISGIGNIAQNAYQMNWQTPRTARA
ncbi:hypothetical protein UFOVP813_24 [uncultured Caudovirales phage]|uniref:Uncharacterized protein n=1 Tax=uncultured Caudovirales phage TaxID=2100421 RepID=A0A6J5NXE4_9CAUD|nr:hypothetical protein UFOVP813_24 [uncultured Caudovirales phage]